MADFTTNMSDTTALDEGIVQEFDAQFGLAFTETATVDQFVTYKKQIDAKSIDFTIYDQLALATTALTEKDDITSEAMGDNKVTLTPAEHGNAVTTTRLVNLQSGGKPDLAAARVVGINAGRTASRLALLAADASTNIILPAGVAAEVNLVAGDVLDAATVGLAYNKLSRANVPGLAGAGSEYALICHDDVIHDLREATATGAWQDVHKYSIPGEILQNEVGMFKGFRVIRNNLATLNTDGGAAAVDSYYSYAIGFNALGKADSQNMNMVLSGPYDKLKRFINIGWYGVFQYKIVQSDALWVIATASSVGINV